MIRAALEEQRASADAFADGLTHWLRGRWTVESEAASIRVAEMLMGWEQSLKKGV